VLEIAEVRRKSEREDGIQRELSTKRVKEIADYCSDPDATFPTPIIIALDEDADFDLSEDLVFSTPGGKIIGEIIDGQHRVKGLQASKNHGLFTLPVVLMLHLNQEERAYVFSIINSKQNKVPMSLIYELFGVSEGRSPQRTCHEIARYLNSDTSSPLHRRLKMLGKKTSTNATLSQASFIKYLLPLISSNPDQDLIALKQNPRARLKEDAALPLRNYFIKEQDEIISKLLFNFFSAMSSVFKHEWDNPNQHILLKPIGYGAFMKGFELMHDLGKSRKDLTADFFTECLTKVKGHLIENNKRLVSSDFASSGQGQKALAEIILAGLRN